MANALNVALSEVTDRYEGTVEPGDTTWVESKIDAAVRELLNIIPSIPTRIASGELEREFVVDKVSDAVLRVVRGPEGFVSEGEGEYNYRLNQRVSSGDLWFPPEDLEQLGYVAPTETASRPKTVFATPSRGFGFP